MKRKGIREDGRKGTRGIEKNKKRTRRKMSGSGRSRGGRRKKGTVEGKGIYSSGIVGLYSV